MSASRHAAREILAARQKYDRERKLAEIKCWFVRAKMLRDGINEIGLSLRYGPLTIAGADWMADELADRAEELAAALRGDGYYE